MTDKINQCPECGQKLLMEVVCPEGYRWVKHKDYSWGRWEKIPKEKKNAKKEC